MKNSLTIKSYILIDECYLINFVLVMNLCVINKQLHLNNKGIINKTSDTNIYHW